MISEVPLPRLGDTVDQVVVVDWIVAPGATVAEGDPLMMVETDKVEVEVTAPFAGTIVELLVSEGDEIVTGTILCRIEAAI